MATHWVDGVNGNDGNDGSTYLLRKKTIVDAATMLGNDTDATVVLNVVASGTYTMNSSSTAVDFNGTSSQSFTVRGVQDDNTETPALVTVESPATGASFFMVPWGGAAATFQYFDVSFEPSKASATTQGFVGMLGTGAQGAIIVEYCRIRGTTDGTVPAGTREVIGGGSIFRDDLLEVRYSVIESVANTASISGSSKSQYSLHNCAIVCDFPAAGGVSWLSGPSFINAANTWSFYANTCFFQEDLDGAFPALTSLSHSAGDVGKVDLYDNVFWADDVGANASSTISSLVRDSNAAASVPSSGTRGFNVFYTGVGFPAADVTKFVEGPSYAIDGTKGYLSDTIVYESTAAALFVDPSVAYNWTPTGSAVAIPISKDLRIQVETDSGVGGGLPGALPAGATDYTVTLATTRENPAPGETVVMTVTCSNAGTDSTGVEVLSAIPSGMTFVSYVASAGTYSSTTGVWTLGNLNDAASETVAITATVDSDQSGNNINWAAAWQDGLPTGGDTSDDNDLIVLAVLNTTDPTDPKSSAAVPFIDTLPIYTTDLKLDLNVQMKTRKNRRDNIILRGDVEVARWREGSFRCINVGTNLTTKLVLGGIQRGKYLIMDSTTEIQISVGNDTNLYFPAKFVVLGSSDFEQVHLKNTSLTVSATVHIGVTD